MLSNAGAARAASEILGFIQTKIIENEDKPEVTTVLRELEAQVTEIQATADSGWY